MDAERFLHAPAAQLQRLCAHFGLPFTERMLHWPAGPRDSDGGGGLRRTRRKIGHEGERARVVRRAALREIRRQPREIRTRDGG
ncbi:MAG: hypothetical protein ACOVQI_13320 [Tagaea sp.]